MKPFDSQIPNIRENLRRSSENDPNQDSSGTTKRADPRRLSCRDSKTRIPADYDRRSIQKLKEMIESQKEEICRAYQGDERLRRDHQLLHEQLLAQNWDLREAHEESLNEMDELKRFQGSTFDTISRRLIEDRDTILELTARIEELQNEINRINDSRDFQDAESVRSEHSHVTSRPVSFPPHPIPEGMLSRSIGMPSRNSGPPSICDTWCIGKRFCKSKSVFFSTLSARVESMDLKLIRTHITTCDE